MSTAPRSKCPDCEGQLHHVRLIDKGHADGHRDLEYTVPEAKRSFWGSQYPVVGRVDAYMCNGCGRLLLYGVPYSEKDKG